MIPRDWKKRSTAGLKKTKARPLSALPPPPSGDSKTGFIYSITIFYNDESECDRAVERIKVSTVIDYVVDDRLYSEFVEDVSEKGVFIRTMEPFAVGQEIVMTFLLTALERPFKVTGEIVRTMPEGIGVRFKRGTPFQEETYRLFIKKIISQGTDS